MVKCFKPSHMYTLITDFFEHYDLLPARIQELIYSEVTGYAECDKLIAQLEPLNMTCDYDLSAEPFDLTPIYNFLPLNTKQ